MRIQPPNVHRLVCLVLLLVMSTSALASQYLLSERTYKRLEAIHALIDKEQYEQALKQLTTLESSVANNPYERALVLQAYGYVNAHQDRLSAAAEKFAACLALDALPDLAAQRLRLTLAQIYASLGDGRKAVATFEAWRTGEKSPSADGLAAGGMIYAQAEDYAAAARYLEQALAKRSDAPEDWYRWLLAVYHESKQYAKAAKLLETMVARYPERDEYWRGLSGVYFTLRQDDKALAVLELAYLKGVLKEPRELTNLANFYLYMQLPQRAAALLEQELSGGRLPGDDATLTLLAEAHFRANDLDESIRTLLRAAARSGDSGHYFRAAELQIQLEQWEQAAESLELALKDQSFAKAARARLLLGIANYERGEREAAQRAFELAGRDEAVRKQAQQWLQFLRETQVSGHSS